VKNRIGKNAVKNRFGDNVPSKSHRWQWALKNRIGENAVKNRIGGNGPWKIASVATVRPVKLLCKVAFVAIFAFLKKSVGGAVVQEVFWNFRWQ
jgi:hypothetical protein